MSTKTWFSVDKEGLAKLLERKGKEFVLYELIQNAWDTSAKKVAVELSAANDLRGYSEIIVTDDHPEGWKDLAHAWTLYAESEKKGNAEKRGRFNLGEKLVLALCKTARIETTTGGVMFDDEGRHTLRTKRDFGSRFYAKIKMTAEERTQAEEAVRRLLPPDGVVTTLNDVEIQQRKPIRVIDCTLPTELADAEGILRRTARKTKIEIHETGPGEVASIYEMGIPVVEVGSEGGDRWHYNVMQKVPLNADRDNVTPAYLREIRTLVLNEMYKEVRQEEATAPWVRDAAEDEDVSKEAMTHVITERFGEKRVIFDPSDQEGTKMAVSQGYSVITPGSLSKEEWSNVRRFEVALPAGQVTPSPRPYSPDGEAQQIMPEEKWTPGIKKVVAYARYVAKNVLSTDIRIKIVTDIKWPFAATFGRSGELALNVGRLGHAWFDAPYWPAVDELLIHEFGHWYCGDHLSHDFHGALCKVGAALAALALSSPDKMNELRKG
jgi:hypothetical protein